jgi:hypothetical protein
MKEYTTLDVKVEDKPCVYIHPPPQVKVSSEICRVSEKSWNGITRIWQGKRRVVLHAHFRLVHRERS